MSITLALALPPPFGGASRSSHCHMVVGKARLNVPPIKQATESQLALQSLLAKRREKYHAKRKGVRERCCSVATNQLIENGGIPSENTAKEEIRATHERRSVLCLASKLQSMKARNDGVVHHPTGNINVNASTINPRSESDIATLDCEELADRVVSKAKVRLKCCKRMSNTFYKTPMNPSSPHLVATSTIRASTPILSLSKTSTPISRSPVKKLELEHVAEPLNLSLDSAIMSVSNKRGFNKVKKVVYLSEKQSITSKDTGIPFVPPSSPQLECKYLHSY